MRMSKLLGPVIQLCYVTGAFLSMCVVSAPVFAIKEPIKPIESTMAYDLFTREQAVRKVPVDGEKLIRSAIENATTMAVRAKREPRTKEDALAAFEAIHLALVKHNFLQPPEEKDWPNTLGIALTPLTFAPEILEAILSFPDNRSRRQYLDLTKPIFFVDCDMGSQFFLAVGERLGWDIRLVELPQHNFVRWHLSESTTVNWDWVHGQSIDDNDYLSAASFSEDIRYRTLYMRSLDAKEAKAYYLGLIGSEAASATDAERLLQEAVTILPNHPLTLNNLAWLYATDPVLAKQRSSLAVRYSLAAWSTRPNHGNFADTVACSLAAAGNKPLALKIEEFAIEHPKNPRQRNSFRQNLIRITADQLCK
jgi:hypothetical protein